MPNEFANKLSKFINSSLPSTAKVFLNNKTSKFDASLIVIWLIAIVTIVLGALWTKLEFNTSLSKIEDDAKNNGVDSNENLVDTKSAVTANTTDSGQVEAATAASKKAKDTNNEEQITTISVGYISILVLLVFVVAILLLLYFFYDYMSK